MLKIFGLFFVLSLIPQMALAVYGNEMRVSTSGDNITVVFETCGVGGCSNDMVNTYSTYVPFKWQAEDTNSVSEAKVRSQKLQEIISGIADCYNNSCHSEKLAQSDSDNELFCTGTAANNLTQKIMAARQDDLAHFNSDVVKGKADSIVQMPTILGALSGRANNEDPKIEVKKNRVSLPTALLYPSNLESQDCKPNHQGWICNITALGGLSFGRHNCSVQND